MKECSLCSRIKRYDSYYFRDKLEGKLHNQCKDCHKKQRKKTWRDYYYKHGSEYRARAVKRNVLARTRHRQLMLTYLSDKNCVRCGVDDIRVLDFDHIDPFTKSFNIARALNDRLNWKMILTEIDKCQILCANCHKIKTATEQGWYRARRSVKSVESD